MNRYVLSRPAQGDLEAIWDYIAEDSADQADRVILKIRSEIRGLAEMPGKGHRRDDLPGTLRAWSVYSYLIVYRTRGELLEVARIVHGARSLPALFMENEK